MKKGEPTFWTEDRGNRLRELWAEGLTAIQCARMISKQFGLTVTRNAVISRIHRWGLPPRGPREEQRRTRVYTTRSEPIPTPDPEPIVQPEPIEPTNPVRLLDTLNAIRQCRWPVDSERDPMCCGAPTVEGTSWCKRHRRLAFSPHQPKKQEAA